MSIWTSLTPRHKQYVLLSIVAGTIVGLLSSITAFIILSFMCGFGLSITGGFAFFMKSKYEADEAKYRTWLIICLTAIISAVLCLCIALFGLYAHQEGWI